MKDMEVEELIIMPVITLEGKEWSSLRLLNYNCGFIFVCNRKKFMNKYVSFQTFSVSSII